VPVGSEQSTRIDLRVVSASHKDLQQAVRLVGAEIVIPPLRERGRDVIELAEAFLARVRAKRQAPGKFSPDAVTALSSYGWPGNVRELRHAIERACAIATGDVIEAADLSLRAPSGKVGESRDTLANRYAALDDNERRLVEEAMAKANNNVAEAARMLGITRIMMKRRLDRFASDES
jgi:Nif-specific regulatory protein